jgi:division protein CdvB (Snf7/Vps24/ESCRT-III family)
MNDQSDRDFSILVMGSAMRAMRELQTIIDIVRVDEQRKAKYGDLTQGVAEIIFEIMDKLVVPTESADPDLKDDMQRRISIFGRAF